MMFFSETLDCFLKLQGMQVRNVKVLEHNIAQTQAKTPKTKSVRFWVGFNSSKMTEEILRLFFQSWFCGAFLMIFNHPLLKSSHVFFFFRSKLPL